MSIIPEGFVYNQSNLQEFLSCERRFYLKYLENLHWPAIQEEPYLNVEQMVVQGQKFHHLVHQFFLGISPEIIAIQLDDTNLKRWWGGFLDYVPLILSTNNVNQSDVNPEYSIFSNISGHRISAKFDLLLKTPSGELIIYDWKTYKKKPKRKWLLERMQTRVYPFLLKHCLEIGTLSEFEHPARIKMVYWFSEFPAVPEIFEYSDTLFVVDKDHLMRLLDSINQKIENEFYPTEDIKQCEYCIYRSFCNRGTVAAYMKDTFDTDEYLKNKNDDNSGMLY